METKEASISGLYYKYKNTTDEKIREYLNNIRIVVLTNKGPNTLHGYYPLSEDSMTKIMAKPRNVSLSFDAHETSDIPMTDLKEWKSIEYLVKSTSRFFLKPDIGEIFDQINWRDLTYGNVKAIEYKPSAYYTLPDTDGEHFVMKATLLVDKDTDIK